jgi:hypothetical protein
MGQEYNIKVFFSVQHLAWCALVGAGSLLSIPLRTNATSWVGSAAILLGANWFFQGFVPQICNWFPQACSLGRKKVPDLGHPNQCQNLEQFQQQ